MDTVLNMKPLSVADNFQKPKDNSIELRNVTHSYDGQTNSLQHISLKIKSGETVAFVGPSGGGKSTLANVISRFFDPSAGDVFIGGVNVKNIKKEELMNTISFVFQNSRLIKASIYENVKMGKPDATREEVLAVLKKAQCTDIIEKLPKGIDTIIGTNGIYLSGGEKQRIAIARVMLKNTPIIILDESTAFADPDNETKVQKAFLELAKGKTVIIIAHRLSTVTGANRIFVIREGQIAEEGNFPTLSTGGGLFRQMWDNYQKSVKWKVSKDFLEDEQKGELI
ncbi:MAG: ABC transporter ATP-binding protein, partial [Lachnospiraceae bacterium]|nr:ABC transporter ATP-binding protein [Lachnospiraceae bacterium]